MKKIVSISFLISFNSSIYSQDKKIESLDSFFAGVPLQKSFNNWVTFISNNPHLGIDSTTERGIYSSFKESIPSNFPFSENCKVKILFAEEIINLSKYRKDLGFDTVKAIMIEGVFENSSKGRQDANKCYLGLIKLISQHYNRSEKWVYSVEFLDGKNSNFPPCTLNNNYNDFSGFPYIIISFTNGKYLKDIFPLKISQPLMH